MVRLLCITFQTDIFFLYFFVFTRRRSAGCAYYGSLSNHLSCFYTVFSDQPGPATRRPPNLRITFKPLYFFYFFPLTNLGQLHGAVQRKLGSPDSTKRRSALSPVFTRNAQHPHTYTTILTYESTLGLPTKPVY